MPSSELKWEIKPNRLILLASSSAVCPCPPRHTHRRPYLTVQSNFNWPIRHPSTNLIINIERTRNDDDNDISWLGNYVGYPRVHASDSRFKAYRDTAREQKLRLQTGALRSTPIIDYTINRRSRTASVVVGPLLLLLSTPHCNPIHTLLLGIKICPTHRSWVIASLFIITFRITRTSNILVCQEKNCIWTIWSAIFISNKHHFWIGNLGFVRNILSFFFLT